MWQSLLTVALLALVWLAWMLRDLVMLVGFAAVFAYALEPIVSAFERIPWPRGRAFPRRLAAGLVILLLALVTAVVLSQALPHLLRQFVRFANAAPGALARLEQELRAFIDRHGLGPMLGSGYTDSAAAATGVLGAIQSGLTSLLGHMAGNLGSLASVVLLPLFAFYMLADRSQARHEVLARVPARRLPQVERFLDALDRALRAYVRGQALVCLAMGTAMAIVLQILGFQVALLLGVVVGLAEIIPILGFWIAAVAIVLEGYAQGATLAVTGFVAYLIVNNLMGTFVSPRLLGGQVKLHPLVVNVAVIGGGVLLGPAGAVLALPSAAIAKSLLDEFGPRPYGSGERGE